MQGLLDPAYLDPRRALIAPDRSRRMSPPANLPTPAKAPSAATTQESIGTSQISIVDDDGNALSMTTTIEQSFGSRLMVRGFLLNNQLTDFSFLPTDEEGRPTANRVEPGKRPRSSLDPTIVFASGRRIASCSALPAGPPSSSHVKGLVGLIDWHLDPQAAAHWSISASTGDTFVLEPDASFDGLARSCRPRTSGRTLGAHQRPPYHRRDG